MKSHSESNLRRWRRLLATLSMSLALAACSMSPGAHMGKPEKVSAALQEDGAPAGALRAITPELRPVGLWPGVGPLAGRPGCPTADTGEPPSFSVLMSVYQAEQPEHLRTALESLVNQSLQADEVVLVEDGPLPAALHETIAAFRDTLNLRSVRLPVNVGLAAALNAGLEHCNHELVARMDSDDISLPQRFEKQVNFMLANPDIAASSASLDEFDETGTVFSSRALPLTHEALVAFARRRSPLSHAVVMFRKSAVLAVGGYPPFKRSQDVALWSLLIVKGYRLANLPDTLFKVRAGAAFMSRNGLRSLRQEFAIIRYQRDIGFLSRREALRNMGVRFILASVPQHAAE